MEGQSRANIMGVFFPSPPATAHPPFSDYSSRLPRSISSPVECCMLNRKSDDTPNRLSSGMYFAKLANTAKRRVIEFTRARVNSIITGWTE